MAVRVRALKVSQNTDKTWVFGWASQGPAGSSIAAATPISFAGMTAKLMVRQNPIWTSNLLLTLATGSGITLGGPTATPWGFSVGTTTIAVTHTQMAASAMPAGSWFYDMVIYNGSLQDVWLQGPFEVVPVVTT